MSSTLTDDVKDDAFLSCRYGDLEDVQIFVNDNGVKELSDFRDDNGNCVLHMICANGHRDLLDYLLPLVPPSLLATQNNAGSTPLHWAALNSQLEIAQKLVQHPDGPGRDLIDIKNDGGRSPLGEAELAGWEEGAKWFVEVMNLEPEISKERSTEEDVSIDTEDASTQDIEVEIEDAEGQVAKMTISSTSSTPDIQKP